MTLTPLEVVRKALGTSLSTAAGDPVKLVMLPALSPAEIEAFARELPCPLPSEVQELLRACSGFEGGAADVVDFTGRSCSFEPESVFPRGLPIAADGFGNFWVVDLAADSRGWGPIYFACHDPPIILYESPNLAHFLEELFHCSQPPHWSLIDEVRDDRIFDVWRSNPGVCSHAAALASPDEALRLFAELLDASFEIVDIRPAHRGARPRSRLGTMFPPRQKLTS